jgi:asparagine synthase (glutamine-hydrolysing)
MCRIVGFWDLSFKGDYDIEETIVKMRDTLVHGGPDDAGVFEDVNIINIILMKEKIWQRFLI